MTYWAREELEQAFETYQRVAADAGRTGDWASWADLFTEDAEYVEHLYGTMRGREAIRAWISETMSTYPGNAMPAFPIGWSVIDEDKGWVICQVWNRMEDPGDGSIHQAYNVTILKYAGDGRWSYEEDIYNPAHFASMIKAWEQRKTELARP
ncbi:MAG: nuclear transport factor 2 family protein [Acidimicrobiia bacterium]|nr:nuclear transport factor 2 family protein [Acidimicrobiia bacterium]